MCVCVVCVCVCVCGVCVCVCGACVCVCGAMSSCNSVANNDMQHVSTKQFHLNANPVNSSQHDPLIEFEMPTYSGSSRKIFGHFLMELDLYFELKHFTDNLKLALAIRAIKDPS